MSIAIGIGILAAILIVWYFAEHVFDEAFEAVWTAAGRLFRRTPKAKGSARATGSTGLLMSREDAVDEGEADV